jgi:hypothetical protein
MQTMQSWINLFKLWDKLTFSGRSVHYSFVRLRNIFGKIESVQNRGKTVKFDKIYTQFVEG